MKTRHVKLTAFLLPALASTAALAVRDPFWPLGYAPAPPPAPVTEVAPAPDPAPKPPSKPAPPSVRPVTDAEWAKARKALPISGFTKSVRPDTNETKILVMINSRSYTAGDTVSFVYDNVRFQWMVGVIKENEVSLKPLTAVRVSPPRGDLSTNQ